MAKVIILGASPEPDRYAHMAQELLIQKGHQPFLVNPKYQKIDQLPCYPNIAAVKAVLNEETFGVTSYVNGKILDSVYLKDLLSIKPAFMIFNPGTENAEAQKQLEAIGCECIIGCTLVMLKTQQFPKI